MFERIKKSVKLVTGIFILVISLGLIGCSMGGDDTGSDNNNHQPGIIIPDVTNIKATAGDGEVTLSWVVPEYPGITKLTISYGNSKSVDADWNSDAYTIKGLSNDTEYTFTVKIVTKNGSSKGVSVKATPKSSNIPAGNDIPDVTNLKATADDGEVTLSWVVPEYPGITKLTISYGNSESVDADWNSDAYTIKGLSNDTEYTFTVKTVTRNGSSKGVTIKATPKGVITPEDDTIPNPINFKAIAGDEKITLSWEVPQSENIKGYLISYDDSKTVDVKYYYSRTETITGLTNGTEYTFTIRSVTETGVSTGVTTTGTPISSKEVYDLEAVCGDSFVKITWKNTETYSTYIIYKNDVLVDSYCMDEFYIFKDLTNGEEYTFKVAKKVYSGDGDVDESEGVEIKATPCIDPARYPNIKDLKAEVKLDPETVTNYIHFTYGEIDDSNSSEVVRNYMPVKVIVNNGTAKDVDLSQDSFDYTGIPVYSSDTTIPVEFNILYRDYISEKYVTVTNSLNITIPKIEEYIPYSYDEAIQNQTIELEEEFNDYDYRSNKKYGYSLVTDWESTDAGIASVTQNGIVTGKSLGNVRISNTQTLRDANGNNITVKQYRDFEVIKKQVKNIDFGRTMPLFVKKGAAPITLDVTLSPDDLEEDVKVLTWSSSNESVATVNNGTINFLNVGYADITAKAISGVTKHLFVSVVPEEATISEYYNDKRIYYKDYENNKEKYIKWKNSVTSHESGDGLLTYEVTMTNYEPESFVSRGNKNDGLIVFQEYFNKVVSFPIADSPYALQLYDGYNVIHGGIEANLLEYNSIGGIKVAIKPVVYKDKIVIYYIMSNDSDVVKSQTVYSYFALKGNCNSIEKTETGAKVIYKRYGGSPYTYMGTSEITVDLKGFEDIPDVTRACVQYGGVTNSRSFTKDGFTFVDESSSTLGDLLPHLYYSWDVKDLAPHTSKLYCITLSTKQNVE